MSQILTESLPSDLPLQNIEQFCGMPDAVARKALHSSGMTSIDQFLAYRPEFDTWGRIRIASILLQAEKSYLENRKKVGHLIPEDWLRQLWSACLVVQSENLVSHKIKIITYNYDRIIEKTLALFASASYGMELGIAANMTNKLEVLHMHGSFGSILPSLEMKGPPFGNNGCPFGATPDIGVLQTISNRYRFVSQAELDKEAIPTARKWLKDAHRIVVIGIGQASGTLQELVHPIGFDENPFQRSRSIDVCTFGLNQSAKSRLFGFMKSLTSSEKLLRTFDNKALAMLQELSFE